MKTGCRAHAWIAAYAMSDSSIRYVRQQHTLCQIAAYAMSAHPEIQHKKPQFQDSLYHERGLLCLISGCTARSRRAGRGYAM
eukprot:3475623-Rhodomonas_salina.1